MDSNKKSFIAVLTLLVVLEPTESTGICKFAEMFPSSGCESCFKRNTTENKGLPEQECPPNMVYGNCSCQPSCNDPTGRSTNSCDTQCLELKTCVCAEGFLKKGGYCVTPSACGCYVGEADLVIPNNETYINASCSEKCVCQNDQLTCNTDYECSLNATCAVKDGVRQCYCNEGFNGDGETCHIMYRDCYDAYEAGQHQNGVYTILPAVWPGSPFDVYCDMNTEGGGWTVFQRRVDGVTDFNRTWESYKNGFGSVQYGRDFWLGNEQLYYLTNSAQRSNRLRIDYVTSEGLVRYTEHPTFRIDNESTNYRLVDINPSYRGNGSHGMYYQCGGQFGTYDGDNDGCESYNCATEHSGGWWYNSESGLCSTCHTSACYRFDFQTCNSFCTYSNLNGCYNGGSGQNIFLAGEYTDCNLNSVELKIRPP